MNERAEKILQLLKVRSTINNQELSRLLNCSTVTVRTTLRELENKGLIQRTHGGVKILQNLLTLSVSPGNVFIDKDKKSKIAEKAYQYVEDRDTIILDDSSNSYHLAQVIKKYSDKRLVVITNSLAVATELSNLSLIDLIVIGGRLTGAPPAFIDDFAINTLKNFKATKAFIGVHSIDPEMGITSIGNEQMRFKQAVFDVSKKVYVLACSNKFCSGYLLVSAKLEQIYRIITDTGISPECYSQACKKVEVDIV